jgi:SAM-dependent methyltransferase
VYGIDASPTMIAAYRKNFPAAHAQCAAVEDSDFFGRSFDAIVAWGFLFLLNEEAQKAILAKASRALRPRGKLLFTAPLQNVRWLDSITARESLSLGAPRYEEILDGSGLALLAQASDEGDNYCYFAEKT